MRKSFIMLVVSILCVVEAFSQSKEWVSVAELDNVLSRYYQTLNDFCAKTGNAKNDARVLALYYMTAYVSNLPTSLYRDVENEYGWKNIGKHDVSGNPKEQTAQKNYLDKIEKNAVVSFSYKLFNGTKTSVQKERHLLKDSTSCYLASLPVWVTITKKNGTTVEGAETITFVYDEPNVWKIIKTEYSSKSAPPTAWSRFWDGVKDYDEQFYDQLLSGLEFRFNPSEAMSRYPMLYNWGLGVYSDLFIDCFPRVSIGLALGFQQIPAYNFYEFSNDAVSVIEKDGFLNARSYDLSLRAGVAYGPVHLVCAAGPLLYAYSLNSEYNLHCTVAIRPSLQVFLNEDFGLSFSCLFTPLAFHSFQGLGIGFFGYID